MIKRIRGFSLIEILIAIGVMAVLSAATISLIGPAPRQRARDAKRWADLEKIASALELYRADTGGYPLGGTNNFDEGSSGIDLVPNYLASTPKDSEGYFYSYSSLNPSTYTLWSVYFETSSSGCVPSVAYPGRFTCYLYNP